FPPPTAWRRWLESRIERAVLAKARAVICSPPLLAPVFRSRLPAADHEDKVVTIPNGYDESDFQVAPISGRARVTFVYVGSFVRDRSPEPLLRGLAALLSAQPDLRGVGGLTL